MILIVIQLQAETLATLHALQFLHDAVYRDTALKVSCVNMHAVHEAACACMSVATVKQLYCLSTASLGVSDMSQRL